MEHRLRLALSWLDHHPVNQPCPRHTPDVFIREARPLVSGRRQACRRVFSRQIYYFDATVQNKQHKKDSSILRTPLGPPELFPAQESYI